MVERQPHWREGEEPLPLVEEGVAAEKIWGDLEQATPAGGQVNAYRANLILKSPSRRLQRRGAFILEAHSEEGGVLLIRLRHGNLLLRRGHIGSSHREPDGGPFFSGPHIHFPTSVFRVIDDRKARTRAYEWNVVEQLSLLEAIVLFAKEINLTGGFG